MPSCHADLGYEACTWEGDTDTVVLDPAHIPLLTAFWRRQYAALRRAQPAAAEDHQRRVDAAKAALPSPPGEGESDAPLPQPAYITVAQLEPHQLAGVAMLRRLYLAGHDAVIADDPAMGIAATVITYLQARKPSERCSLVFIVP